MDNQVRIYPSQFEKKVLNQLNASTRLLSMKPDTLEYIYSCLLYTSDNPDYDLSHSFVIGDRPTDVELAKNLGCRAILLQDDTASLKPVSEAGGAACDELEDYCALSTRDWDKVAEFLFAGERTAEVRRTTKETDIYLSLIHI